MVPKTYVGPVLQDEWGLSLFEGSGLPQYPTLRCSWRIVKNQDGRTTRCGSRADIYIYACPTPLVNVNVVL